MTGPKPGYVAYTYPHPLTGAVSAIREAPLMPHSPTLFSAVPNPLNYSVLLCFHNPKKEAQISVYSVSGRKIITLRNIQSDKVEWKPKDLAEDIYVLKLNVNGKVFTQRICLVK
jgi:hypothetical protein